MNNKSPKRWFRIIKNDPDKISEAMDWYMEELERGEGEIAIGGNLLHCNQTHPGLIAYFDAMHTDLDMILELVERDYRLTKGRIMKQWANDPPTQRKLSTTEIKEVLETEDEVIEAYKFVEDVRYVYEQYSSLMKALEQRGYTLNNIVKLRIANMEEVEV
jgi:hypothetical protein